MEEIKLYKTQTQDIKPSLGKLDEGILSLAAMLNKSGKGKVYFGVADDGTIVGLKNSLGKETIKKIGVRISEAIQPTVIPKIYLENHDSKIVVVIEVEGYNKPYAANGEYRIRIGSENKKIEPNLLGEIFFTNSTAIAANVEAINQNLTFNQLKNLYIAKGLTIDNATFIQNLGLLTKRGTYNYIADILSDNNDCSIKVVRFKGQDKKEMISRNEYGYKCLLNAMKQAFDYVSSLNEVRVNLHGDMVREETHLFDLDCFDEAWTNACLHNRWVKNVPPAIYIYSNRIEIISTGGLPIDFTKEEFLAGISRPLNLTLQKIMGQLGLVEQTGHGVPKIVSVYGKEAFEFGENYILVKIPFAFEPSMNQVNYDGLSPIQIAVLKEIRKNPFGKVEEFAQRVGLGRTRAGLVIAKLKELGVIKRVGGRKGGHWQTF
jgi:predicted HTH transcriptional regulator